MDEDYYYTHPVEYDPYEEAESGWEMQNER